MEFSKIMALATLLVNCIMLTLVYPFLNKRNKNAVAKALGICVPAASIGVTIIVAYSKLKYANEFIVLNIILIAMIIISTIAAIKKQSFPIIRNTKDMELKIIMIIANTSLALDLLAIFTVY